MNSRRMRLTGHVTLMGEMRRAYNVWMGKSERKRLLRELGLWWECNIKLDVGNMPNWIHLAQDRDHWWALDYTTLDLHRRLKGETFCEQLSDYYS
jgi:hypothetical protein